jgi:hypothetical protein
MSPSSSSLKRALPPNSDARINKRPKFEGEASSRKQFLNSLRAICDRWAVHVRGEGDAVVDGKELLRLFLRDTLPPKGKKFPLQGCDCRHKGGYLPSDREMCRTAGTVDNGKANAFVMSDLKHSLRNWLKTKRRNPHFEVTDVEDSDEEEVELEESASQPISLSSYDVDRYPSSPVKQGDSGWKRKSTKQRLTVLFYLLHHSNSCDTFNSAFKELCLPDLHLVHLCGCGLNIEGLYGACVVGSHLKLASSELNREHVHYHFVLAHSKSKEAYLATLAAIKGGSGGRFDDVF